MSIRVAPRGGASRVCSAPAVYNAMLERCPELAKALTEPIDRIWEGVNGFFRLPVVGLTPSGQFTTQISPSYVENAQFLEHATKATPVQIAALDAIEEIGMELGAEFIMQPGMLYFLNNHQVYHGRGNWDVTEGEQQGEWGNEGRLLFRTWISPYNSRPLPETDEYRTVWGSVEGGRPRGGWDQAVKTGDSPKPKIPDDHRYYSLFSDRVQQHSMHGHCKVVIDTRSGPTGPRPQLFRSCGALSGPARLHAPPSEARPRGTGSLLGHSPSGPGAHWISCAGGVQGCTGRGECLAALRRAHGRRSATAASTTGPCRLSWASSSQTSFAFWTSRAVGPRPCGGAELGSLWGTTPLAPLLAISGPPAGTHPSRARGAARRSQDRQQVPK